MTQINKISKANVIRKTNINLYCLVTLYKSQHSFFSLPDKRKAETKKVCGPFGKIPRDIPDSVHSVGRPVAVQAAEEDLFITSPQHTGLTYLQ